MSHQNARVLGAMWAKLKDPARMTAREFMYAESLQRPGSSAHLGIAEMKKEVTTKTKEGDFKRAARVQNQLDRIEGARGKVARPRIIVGNAGKVGLSQRRKFSTRRKKSKRRRR